MKIHSERIDKIRKTCWHALICILLGVFYCHCSRSGGKDILTPEERHWLMENQSRIVLAVETNYQPFVFLDSKDQITGLAHDYILLLESKLGIHFKQRRFSSLDDIFEKVQIGEIHIVNAVTETPWRSTILSFTTPYISVPNVIIVREDRSGRIHEENLSGLRLSLPKGYAVTEHLMKKDLGFVPDLVPDNLTALLNVSFGRSDAAVIDLASASYLISQKNITNLRIAGETAFEIQLASGTLIVEPVLHSILQKGYDSITDAERQEIHNRWIIRDSHIIFSDWRFWGVVGSVLFVVFTIIAGILTWNKALRKQVALRTQALENEKTALQKSENFLKRAATAGKVGLWDMDIFTGQVFFSTEWKKQIGYEDHEIEGHYKEWESRLYPDDLDKTISALKASQTPPWPPYQIEFRLRHKDGSYRWILAIGTIEFDEHRQPIRMIGSHVDITERKQAENEKLKLEAQLQQAQRMESVGRLAGGVAHDFNNMLGVILGHVEMALEQVDPMNTLHDDLTEILMAANRSADLTRQLLAYARKQTVSPKALDLNNTVMGMLNMLRRLIGENIDLAWMPGADLWLVNIDPSQIDQMLANLCVNARDAIADVGRITIETGNSTFDVAYCADHPGFTCGDYVHIVISDTGCGMDKETQTHIFEPFFTTKDISKGTGLGLATVYGAVKQNNGFINAYSEMGQGTIFTIYLPRHKGESEPMKTVTLDEPVAKLSTETILLVEDEPSILKLTTMILTRQGYTVLKASTPHEAIRLAGEYPGRIHLIITDVVMPEMNGRDLTKKLMTLLPTLKCMFMSGYTADVIAHQGVLDQGVHFIQKPFSKKDLIAKVREALDCI